MYLGGISVEEAAARRDQTVGRISPRSRRDDKQKLRSDQMVEARSIVSIIVHLLCALLRVTGKATAYVLLLTYFSVVLGWSMASGSQGYRSPQRERRTRDPMTEATDCTIGIVENNKKSTREIFNRKSASRL